MKIFFAILTFFFLTAIGHASTMPTTECVNVGQTLRMKQPNVFLRAKFLEVLISKYDAQGNLNDQVQEFNFDELNILESEKTELAHEKRGCTTRNVYSVKMTFTRKDGNQMPHAYNRLANEDGSLSDYFLCARSTAWMAPPGGNCQ